MKIKYSALVMGASGKLNGSVAASNKGGAYIRNKGVVSNPQTVAQQEVRGRFGAISSQFRALTPSQIAAWNTAAADFPVIDRLGDTRYLSGLGLFVQLNTNLQSVGLPAIVNPPVKQTFPSLTPLELAVIVTAGSISTFSVDTVTSVALDEGEFLFAIKAAPLTSPSVQNQKNAMRLIGSYPSLEGTGQNFDIASLYEARFGNVAAVGQKVQVEITLVSAVSGEASLVYSGVAYTTV